MVSCEVYSHDFGLTLDNLVFFFLFFFLLLLGFFFSSFFLINLSWEHLQLQSEHGGYTGTALYVKSCLNAILVVKLLHWGKKNLRIHQF